MSDGRKLYNKQPQEATLHALREIIHEMELPLKANNPNYITKINYSNSIELAAKTIDSLVLGESSTSIMVAHLQSGKTAAQLIFMSAARHLFHQLHEKHNIDRPIKVGIYFITNKSLTELYNQSIFRLKEIGFKEKEIDRSNGNITLFQNLTGDIFIEPIMLSSNAFKKSDEEKIYKSKDTKDKFSKAKDKFNKVGCTHFVIINDEGHIAIKRDQQFDNFIKDCLQIEKTSNKITEFNPPFVFVGCTATPYLSFIDPSYNSIINLVYGNPPENYFGLEKMIDRIKDRKGYTIEQELESDLISNSDKNNPKYFIMRLKNREMKFINNIANKHDIIIREFNSSNGNINQLLNYIKDKPDENKIVLIKDALGAGVTIENIEHIGGWFDTGYSNMESIVQSLGRMCHADGLRKDRLNSNFPIFCDKEKVEEYIKIMKDLENGVLPITQETRNNVNGKISKPQWYPPEDANYILGTSEEYEENIKRILQQNNIFDSKENYFNKNNLVKQVNISKNNSHDVSDYILRNIVDSNPLAKIIPGKNKKFEKSFDKLCKKYPEISVNKNLVFYWDKLEFGLKPTEKKANTVYND